MNQKGEAIKYTINLMQYLLSKSKAEQIGSEPSDFQKGYDKALERTIQDLIMKLESQEPRQTNHEHYTRGGTSRICTLCGGIFDVPIKAIIKNDIVLDSNKNEERRDVLPSRDQRTANINHGIRRSMGERPKQADSDQSDSGWNETKGRSRDKNHPSSQGISEKTIHPQSLRQIKPIILRPTEERLA